MAMGDTHYLDTWRTMEQILKKTSKIKAIGLCNFTQQQVQDIIDNCSVVPAIHQMELHRRSFVKLIAYRNSSLLTPPF
jgi:alcohol dehydrogenase (NADP+)